MINWEAIRKLVKADREWELAYEELQKDNFVRQIEAKIMENDFSIRNGRLVIKMGDMSVHECIEREALLRNAGYKFAEGTFKTGWLLRTCTEWELSPKES